MNENIKLALRCPKCKSRLRSKNMELTCCNSTCGKVYPIINDIPILINEENSAFSISEFVNYKPTFFKNSPNLLSKLKSKLIPSITFNHISAKNYSIILELLQRKSSADILVIGGSIDGKGFNILRKENFNLTETDISFGPNTKIICDAHDIPFSENFFDCVICQAVLEHVLDPYRVVEEIYRVSKNGGIVYSETPFMQQVHGRQYDFTRFSLLGHRRLFRKFEVIEDGLLIGTGSSLAWTIKYFIRSFFKQPQFRKIAENLSVLLFFWLKYFDVFTNKNESSLDGASAYYFLGEKTDKILTDSLLLKLYRGGF